MNKEKNMTMKLNPYFKDTIETSNVVWSHDENSYQFNFDFTEYLCDKPFDLTDGKPRILLEFLNDKNAEVQIYPLVVDSEKLGVAHFIIPERVLGYVGDVKASLTIDFSNKSYDLGNFSFRMKKSPIDNKMPQLQFYVDEFEKAQDIFKNGLDEFNDDIKDSNAKVDEIKDLIVQNDVLKKAEAGSFEEFREQDDTIISKMKNEFTDRGVNVLWFGAKGDNLTDDTISIKSAISYCKKEDLDIYFPSNKKYRITDTIDLTGLNVYCEGTLTTSIDKKPAVRYGSPNNSTLYKTIKISVERDNWTDWSDYKTNDFSNTSIGIYFENLGFCNIILGTIKNFTINTLIHASNSKGFYFNKIKMANSSYSKVHLQVSSTLGGWPNGNNFSGGSFTNGEVNALQPRNVIKFTTDGKYTSNSNVFREFKMEGTYATKTPNAGICIPFHVEGTANKFINFRDELVANSKDFATFGKDASFNYIEPILGQVATIPETELFNGNFIRNGSKGLAVDIALTVKKYVAYDSRNTVESLKFENNQATFIDADFANIVENNPTFLKKSIVSPKKSGNLITFNAYSLLSIKLNVRENEIFTIDGFYGKRLRFYLVDDSGNDVTNDENIELINLFTMTLKKFYLNKWVLNEATDSAGGPSSFKFSKKVKTAYILLDNVYDCKVYSNMNIDYVTVPKKQCIELYSSDGVLWNVSIDSEGKIITKKA